MTMNNATKEHFAKMAQGLRALAAIADEGANGARVECLRAHYKNKWLIPNEDYVLSWADYAKYWRVAPAKQEKTAHELARELLAGPDLPIRHFDPEKQTPPGEDDESYTMPVVEVVKAPKDIADIVEESSGASERKIITIRGGTN
jgi:hypothetical protein